MGGVTPPPPSTVSVPRQIDFAVAHYTTDGIIDDSKFSLDTISRYIEELQTYQNILEYINEAFLVVWLWRGHYPVEVAGKTYKLPIHSFTVGSKYHHSAVSRKKKQSTLTFHFIGLYMGYPRYMELESVTCILGIFCGMDTTSNKRVSSPTSVTLAQMPDLLFRIGCVYSEWI
jgi:hypothetical protein